MNNRFGVEVAMRHRKSSISPWDAEDMFEGLSPLRRVKAMHRHFAQTACQIEEKKPEKIIDKVIVPIPDRSWPASFVIHKHHKAVPKGIITVELPTEEAKD